MAVDLTIDERAQRALGNAIVPRLYFNGFVNVLGTADVTTILEANGTPVAIVSMSFTTAKTLSQKLNEIVTELENIAKREIMTTDVIDAAIKKSKGKSN